MSSLKNDREGAIASDRSPVLNIENFGDPPASLVTNGIQCVSFDKHEMAALPPRCLTQCRNVVLEAREASGFRNLMLQHLPARPF